MESGELDETTGKKMIEKVGTRFLAYSGFSKHTLTCRTWGPPHSSKQGASGRSVGARTGWSVGYDVAKIAVTHAASRAYSLTFCVVMYCSLCCRSTMDAWTERKGKPCSRIW
eukprot:scaffold318_cov396-Prasinococcus_capsulatus_cf.AAC.5